MLLEHPPHGFLRGLEREVPHVKLDLVATLGIERPESPRTYAPRPPRASPAGHVRGSFPPGLALVDADRASVELALVHLGDGVLGRSPRAEGDESEASGAGRAALHGEEDVGDGAEGSEDLAEAGLVGGCVWIGGGGWQ